MARLDLEGLKQCGFQTYEDALKTIVNDTQYAIDKFTREYERKYPD